jgi:acyl-CoA synthetase (NDP forming)
MRDLSRLLRPQTIAVVGGKPAAEVIRQNRRMGFSGRIWPIHPTRDSIEGLPAFRAPRDLPQAPDAVFLAVNRHLTIDYVRAFAGMGAGGVVCYAAGFAEAGTEGEALQVVLREAAGDMPVLGPNCYGLINYIDGALLWPDQHGGARVSRGVAIITQSGNIGCNVTMQRRGLPIAYLCTMGNQAVIGLSAAVETLARDSRVTAIGLHIEGIDDAAAFADAVAVAHAKKIPIVVLKTGSSTAGAGLTVSHTASLAGSDKVFSAFLRRLGVARVRSIPVLLETLKLLHMFGPLPGRDIASMSCSGGEAALIADRAEGRAIRFRPLRSAEADAVRATLPDLVTVSNPLDYHTFSWADEAALTRTFEAMMRQDFDLTALILDYPRADLCDERDWIVASEALASASRATGARAAVIATLPECIPEGRAQELMAEGIAPLLGLDDALDAIEVSASIAPGLTRRPLVVPAPRGVAITLDEVQSKQALATFGVQVPTAHIAVTSDDAANAAASLGYPVVMKAVSAGLAHKTEVGAVRLDLRDGNAVRAAADALLPLGESLLLEEMVTDAVAEVLVGIARDPIIGPHLVLASGGVLVELVGDSVVIMLPASEQEIRAAIAGLRVGILLAGYRGKPEGDVDALVRAVLAVQTYALSVIDQLLELDVNPVMVRPAGRGAVAVDAVIRLAKESA